MSENQINSTGYTSTKISQAQPQGISLNNLTLSTKELSQIYMMGNVSAVKDLMGNIIKRTKAQTEYIKECNNLMASISSLQSQCHGDPNATVDANSVISTMEHLGMNNSVVWQYDSHSNRTSMLNANTLAQNSTVVSNRVQLANQKATQLNNELSQLNSYLNKYTQFVSNVLEGVSRVLNSITSKI